MARLMMLGYKRRDGEVRLGGLGPCLLLRHCSMGKWCDNREHGHFLLWIELGTRREHND